MRRFKDALGDWRGYAVAVVLVGLATWLKYLAQPDIIPSEVPILYFLAIVPTAIFFGLGPSVLVCVLSLLSFDYFFYTPQVFSLTTPFYAPILIIFLFVGLSLSYISSALRSKNRMLVEENRFRKKVEAELTEYRDRLQEMVTQKTRELEETAQRLRLSQEAAGAGSWEWELATNKNHWSPEIWKLYGLESVATEPSYEVWASTVHPEDWPSVEKAVQEAAKLGTKLSAEWRVKGTTAPERWLMSVGQPVLDADGKARRYLGIVIDITERKQLETIKDEFIGMVSHELKTPLAVITGALNMAMKEDVAQDERKALMEDAAWGAETMADIVENLLELSRYQANRLVLQEAALDIGPVVSRLVRQSSKKSSKHEVVASVEEGLPRIKADRIRVERILDNLIDNAIKYSPHGGEVTLTVKRQGDEVLFQVSDQGIGISPGDIEKLFQPFGRLETAVSGSAIQGVGLGLVVCRHLVEAHGGRIWVGSEPGKGSTFCFTLPLRQDP